MQTIKKRNNLIIGIGTDICKIARIEKLMQFKSITRIFSKEELEKIQHFDKYVIAKKWAAKEAFAKATGLGIGQLGFANITIDHIDSGKPFIKLNEISMKAIDSVIKNNNYVIHLSISDEIDYAIATVILESV
jgi:holo-[acyl-carrier protein] synthase